ncbi:asparagine synthase (glutamine-hydrolyzing) [Pseudaminobacter soli (ex Li et al. 2025)]|uniref:asparagine synthase (glutamine-hydrolyzing) n=1 Tax=Pseudaminobacter soli (ex Li et al. 2025) TaxID=1295366 RepID=A0A2P7SD66_9HYPH|nr:asparagine synthase (glutamine-hydrolyzing) [Mesorhizobium soli]PSJ60285.1 asparagine synthase (glutamine-hydrolyzing) [Mesorhizobium soli]
MCGIFGFHARSRLSLTGELDKATDLLAHRGPDGRGTFVAHSPDSDWQVGLGHRRLSIVDIEGSPQPMHSHDGRYVIVYNGEIYNYIELRAELVERGHRFATLGDTEVLIEAWRAWGEDCLARLNGMFAFLLWDTATGQLFAARDPFGKKPLFVAKGEGFHAFASEIEPLRNFPGVDDRLDQDSLREYLSYRYVPGPATFFRGISKVPPGTFVAIDGAKIRSKRYFTTPFSRTKPDIDNFDEAVALFADKLDEAVRLRLRSDAPFGAYLSGGLDSSTIVALMSRQMAKPVSTFSVGFDAPGSSELPYARQVAQAFGTDHHELAVGMNEFTSVWEEAVLRRGAPVAEPSDLPVLLLSRLASRSVKMVLTGEGADELLGGYPKHRAEPWVAMYQRLVPGALHDGLVAPAVRALPYAARRVKTLAGVAGVRDLQARMAAWFGGADGGQAEMLYAGSPQPRDLDPLPFASDSASSALKRMLHFDQTSWLPDNLLERGDRMMMAGSIEGRMPFMDVGLAELAARFPDAFLTGAPKGKRVLRVLASKLLPREIIERKKVGFRVPVEQWFRAGMADQLRDLLQSGDATVRQVCNAREIDRLVGEHLGGTQNHEKILWALANLEQFFRIFRPTISETATRRREPDYRFADSALR